MHALGSNEKALVNFNKLALSYRRQYVGWVNSAKKEETRRKRLAEALRTLGKKRETRYEIEVGDVSGSRLF
jgi:uncharacterized protein YdeI (YjbR/CyaY-like superfamily)